MPFSDPETLYPWWFQLRFRVKFVVGSDSATCWESRQKKWRRLRKAKRPLDVQKGIRKIWGSLRGKQNGEVLGNQQGKILLKTKGMLDKTEKMIAIVMGLGGNQPHLKLGIIRMILYLITNWKHIQWCKSSFHLWNSPYHHARNPGRLLVCLGAWCCPIPCQRP